MAKSFFVDRRVSPNGRKSAINMDNVENLLPYVLGIIEEEVIRRGLVNNYGYEEVIFDDTEQVEVEESTINVYQVPGNLLVNTILLTPYVGEGSADYYVYLPDPNDYDGRTILFIRKEIEGAAGNIYLETNSQPFAWGSESWNMTYANDRVQLISLNGMWYLVNSHLD